LGGRSLASIARVDFIETDEVALFLFYMCCDPENRKGIIKNGERIELRSKL
jgi:hypothetical protein